MKTILHALHIHAQPSAPLCGFDHGRGVGGLVEYPGERGAQRERPHPFYIRGRFQPGDASTLQEGRSRFYAEILKIHAVVTAARQAPLLFLLDEILHGTNSYDRRIGAEAIVRALVSCGAIGFITTHDLALTELPSTLGTVAANMHFEDRLEDGKMVFDYTMRPGVVEHSNALALMRAIGLNV